MSRIHSLRLKPLALSILSGLPGYSQALRVVIPITCDSLGVCSGFPAYDPNWMTNSSLALLDSFQTANGDTTYLFTPLPCSSDDDSVDSGGDDPDMHPQFHSMFDGDGDTSYNVRDLTQEQRDDEMFNARNDSYPLGLSGWTYQQATGNLYFNGNNPSEMLLVGQGYSGRGIGFNNPGLDFIPGSA